MYCFRLITKIIRITKDMLELILWLITATSEACGLSITLSIFAPNKICPLHSLTASRIMCRSSTLDERLWWLIWSGMLGVRHQYAHRRPKLKINPQWTRILPDTFRKMLRGKKTMVDVEHCTTAQSHKKEPYYKWRHAENLSP